MALEIERDRIERELNCRVISVRETNDKKELEITIRIKKHGHL
jgi:hypothetical protein